MAHRHARGARPQDPDVKLSKFLSWVLRHGAGKAGLTLQTGGYLYVEDILALEQCKSYTEKDIQRVVLTNEKQRFFMENEQTSGKLRIRANQGHSVQVTGLDMTRITQAEDYPVVLHGTYRKCWPSIAAQGLSRMNRTHIHFAAGEPQESGIISGMRGSCDVLIYVDLQAALEDGFEFFLSANGVILTPGDKDGHLPPKYFSKVLDRRTRRELI